MVVPEPIAVSILFPGDAGSIGIQADPVFCQPDHRDAGIQAFKKHLAQSLRYAQSYGLALGVGSASGTPAAVIWMPRLGWHGDHGIRLVCVAKTAAAGAGSLPGSHLVVSSIVPVDGENDTAPA
jgi:hypothetical protein